MKALCAAQCLRSWLRSGNNSGGAALTIATIATAAVLLGQAPDRSAIAAAAPQAEKPRVSYVEAKRGKDSGHVTLPATLQAMQEATLHARTSGYVKKWTAEIGDRVSRGQLLVEIEAPELDRELEQSRANLGQIRAQLDLARATATRYRALVKDEAVSSQEVDEKLGALAAREADLASATAKVRQLESLKSFQRITAPFNGTITARNVEIAMRVSLIVAVSLGAQAVTYDAAHWAIGYVRTHSGRAITQLRINMSDGPFHRLYKAVLRLVAEAPASTGITTREIGRRCRPWNQVAKKMQDDCLAALMRDGYIAERQRESASGRGRTGVAYFLNTVDGVDIASTGSVDA